MMRLLLAVCLVVPSVGFAESPDLAPIKKWIAGQESVRTVQADFTQTRSYRALRDPLVAKGRLLYGAAVNGLRWEVGEPPKMIYLRKGDSALLIQPAKKRAERVAADLKPGADNPRAFAIPRFPLAKDFADFTRQFEVLSVTTKEGHCHFEVLPREPQAQKFVAAIKIDFETASGQLTAFEIALRDGATMRNDFTNVRLNQKLPSGAFEYDLTGLEVSGDKE